MKEKGKSARVRYKSQHSGASILVTVGTGQIKQFLNSSMAVFNWKNWKDIRRCTRINPAKTPIPPRPIERPIEDGTGILLWFYDGLYYLIFLMNDALCPLNCNNKLLWCYMEETNYVAVCMTVRRTVVLEHPITLRVISAESCTTPSSVLQIIKPDGMERQ